MKTVTAFTVAHSITLALATLGIVHVPSSAGRGGDRAEHRLRRGRDRAGTTGPRRARGAERRGSSPSPSACCTGFGFAGALSEVGLPEGHIPVALLFFNLGVEAGQLLFIAAVLALVAAARRVRMAWPRWAGLVPPYAIGSVAMFWVIQRVAAF